MNSTAAQRVILGAWLGMIALATIRRVTAPTSPGLPVPATFLGISVLFTMLFGVASAAPGFAAAIAVGVDVGALLSPYAKNNPRLSPLATLAGYLDALAGADTSAAAAVAQAQAQTPASQATAGTLRPGQPF